MFTARSVDDNAWTTSIAPEWRGREEELRDWARAERLVCPGCGQLLHFRFRQDEAGSVKRRPHFAHRAKSDCPLEHQSAEVMEAKALLYEWLQSKFPGDVVMDWPVEIAGWDRPADVYVMTGKKRPLAYWVFDRGVRDRWAFVGRFLDRTGDFACQAVWATSTMVFHEGKELLKLTPTQRDLMARGPDADPYVRGDRLTFLDAGTGELTLYRGLNLTHAPNLHAWRIRREGALTGAKVDPTSGEILFQEDVEQRAAEKEAKRQREEEERIRREEEEKRRQDRLKNPPIPVSAPPSTDRIGRDRFTGGARGVKDQGWTFPTEALSGRVPEPAAPSPWAVFHQPLKCEGCGEMTADWSTAQLASGTCVCRVCMAKREKD